MKKILVKGIVKLSISRFSSILLQREMDVRNPKMVKTKGRR